MPVPVGEVDYFQETNGERSDRLDSKSKAAQMAKGRREDVKQAKFTEFQGRLYTYIVVNVLAWILAFAGILTVSWFHYEGTFLSLSTVGNSISVSEDWAIAVNGLAVHVEYCDQTDGACSVDNDDFRYFNPGSDDDFQWPVGVWADAAAKAAIGSTYLIAGVGAYIACNIMGTVTMSMAFCDRDTRFRMIMGTMVSVVSLGRSDDVVPALK
jgi:hypothetical protein